MAFYAAIWAMPVVAPIIVGTLVFIVLASVAIGVGTSHHFPGVVTFGLVAVSAWLAGMAYKRVHTSFNPPQSSRFDMSPEYMQQQYAEVSRPALVSGQSILPTPVMPRSIIP